METIFFCFSCSFSHVLGSREKMSRKARASNEIGDSCIALLLLGLH